MSNEKQLKPFNQWAPIGPHIPVYRVKNGKNVGPKLYLIFMGNM